MSSLLAALNPVQREAAAHQEGPLLILAGAGSGKTRVLTYRVAHLIEQGVAPYRILAVTFTNKAAGEMRDRIHRLVGEAAQACWLGTFHSLCARILRTDGAAINLPRDFVVYDDSDQLTLVKEAMREADVNPEQYKPREILTAISHAKEAMQSPEAFAREAHSPSDKVVARVYPRYQQKLKANHAVDFDDLLLETVRLFRESPETRERYQGRFEHVMVDEYQDINLLQYEFIRILAEKHRNLCVVGDDDQSIYGWRGADIRFILAFEKDYPEARVLKLEQNYRSTQTILEAAHAVVSRNRGRRDKKLWTENPSGEPITLYVAADELDEARFVAQTVENSTDGRRVKHGDFAVLYRTNAQSRVMEDVFRRRRIPYRIVGGVRFYDRKEIRDVLAYLRVLGNPADSLAVRRALGFPSRGVGEKSLERLEAFAAEQDISLYSAMARAAEIEGLAGKARNVVLEFVRVLDWIRITTQDRTVTEILREVLDKTGYMQALHEDRSPEARDREDNVKEFASVTREYDDQVGGGLSGFLEQMSLISDVDTLKAGLDSVVLMTMHAAKGLEFPYVFICGLEDDIFPHSRALLSDREMEEERRLCYVGITRARLRLILSYARRRTFYGQQRPQRASRFLREIPESYIQDLSRTGSHREDAARRGRYQDTDGTEFAGGRVFGSGTGVPRSAPPPAPAGIEEARRRLERVREARPGTFKAGDRVKHPNFGIGIVTASLGSGDDEQVTVVFPGHGQKKLIAGYARLEKL